MACHRCSPATRRSLRKIAQGSSKTSAAVSKAMPTRFRWLIRFFLPSHANRIASLYKTYNDHCAKVKGEGSWLRDVFDLDVGPMLFEVFRRPGGGGGGAAFPHCRADKRRPGVRARCFRCGANASERGTGARTMASQSKRRQAGGFSRRFRLLHIPEPTFTSVVDERTRLKSRVPRLCESDCDNLHPTVRAKRPTPHEASSHHIKCENDAERYST